ncbi:spermatogenesis associated 6-like protein isoform X2 [Triplophysa rosa]|uniref:spermatogenesis associated 6-like protein isoform X2 n=1 Tax=Triplophysa rosa TaxID=992332 RepID=UPI002545EE4E|nr:spermatogenesis associated 6-like protein isoform X2 [Triplophysa rosa]
MLAVTTKAKMPHKAVKVIVELHLRAITCPGVHLPAKDDVYVSVCLMNQYRKSACLPAVFPLIIREKIRFEKLWKCATDPAAIAEFLQCETVKVELIQLTPPSGRILASFEEDARSFLFPEPKLVPSFSGVQREVLMTRDPTFPGISPRLEFSTKTTISEINNRDGSHSVPAAMTRKSTKKARQGSAVSQIHPFSAPRRQTGLQDRDQVQMKDSWTGGRISFYRSPNFDRRLGSLSPNYTSRLKEAGICSSPFVPDGDSSDTDDLLDYAEEVGQRHSLKEYEGSSSPSHSSTESQRHNGCVFVCVFSRSLLGSSGVWEEVQERVQSLLTSPKAVYRLACGASESEIDEVLMRRSIVAHSCSF